MCLFVIFKKNILDFRKHYTQLNNTGRKGGFHCFLSNHQTKDLFINNLLK